MSLLSGVSVVEEDSEVEECFSSLAHPAREASAKAARQERIKVEERMDVFVMVINVRIAQEPTSAMGSIPHDVRAVVRWQRQVMFITSVCGKKETRVSFLERKKSEKTGSGTSATVPSPLFP